MKSKNQKGHWICLSWPNRDSEYFQRRVKASQDKAWKKLRIKLEEIWKPDLSTNVVDVEKYQKH